MWKTLHASNHNAELQQVMTDLVQDTLRSLILMTSGVYLALQVLISAFGSEQVAMTIWYMIPIVLLSGGLALRLLDRRLLAAQIIWLAGLALLITVSLYVFRRPDIAFLYALLPFIAVITAGGWAGLIAGGGVVALPWAQSSLVWGLLPRASVIPVAAGCVFAGLVGWAASRTLYTVAGWSLEGFERARRNMDEARQHRAQLAELLKDLDQAYYRLERTNAALVVAWRASAEAEQFKAEFAANLSHELRTPLNLIIGFAEMMLTAPHKYEGVEIPRAYRSDLEAVYQNARHLEALVNDVLDLARIDVGRLGLARDEVDLPALIEEVAGMVRDYITAKGLELRLRLAPKLPAAHIDRLRIRQVLLNLVVNAARFTDSGWIEFEAQPQGDKVLLRVTDTGRGIAESELPRIFDEFTQAGQPSAAVGWAGGTGLGLPISRKLVELHGGEMGVESTYLRGTTFWFTLPCAAEAPAEKGAPRLVRARPLRRLRPEKRLLVVVHEDTRVVSLLQRYLDGYRLIAAHSAEEGAALAREAHAVGIVSAGPLALDGDLIHLRCPLPDSRESARLLGARDLLVTPILADDLWRAIEGLGQPIRRVLVADDDADMVRLIQRMLIPRIAPQDCYEAANGEEALAVWRARQPDLVLLDLMMPNLTGAEVLAQTAQEPALAQTPVIIISARDQEEIELPLTEPLQVSKPGGLRLGELARALEANLQALAPGWH